MGELWDSPVKCSTRRHGTTACIRMLSTVGTRYLVDSASVLPIRRRPHIAQFQPSPLRRLQARGHCQRQGFEMKWTLTPQRGGRQIEVTLAHPKLIARHLPEGSRDAFPCANPHLTFAPGALTLRFSDVIGDLGELIPCTHRLLALAATLRSGQQIHTFVGD